MDYSIWVSNELEGGHRFIILTDRRERIYGPLIALS